MKHYWINIIKFLFGSWAKNWKSHTPIAPAKPLASYEMVTENVSGEESITEILNEEEDHGTLEIDTDKIIKNRDYNIYGQSTTPEQVLEEAGEPVFEKSLGEFGKQQEMIDETVNRDVWVHSGLAKQAKIKQLETELDLLEVDYRFLKGIVTFQSKFKKLNWDMFPSNRPEITENSMILNRHNVSAGNETEQVFYRNQYSTIEYHFVKWWKERVDKDNVPALNIIFEQIDTLHVFGIGTKKKFKPLIILTTKDLNVAIAANLVPKVETGRVLGQFLRKLLEYKIETWKE
jgi:hypothetical protein